MLFAQAFTEDLSLRRARQCDSKANTPRYFVAATQLPVNFSFTNQRSDSFSSGVNTGGQG
jgi:hypothetical protein